MLNDDCSYQAYNGVNFSCKKAYVTDTQGQTSDCHLNKQRSKLKEHLDWAFVVINLCHDKEQIFRVSKPFF